jgi:hypothetical protein
MNNILAKARPNQLYMYINNLADLVLEAHLVGNQIHYFETHKNNPNWVVRLKEDTVKALFVDDINIKQRPFLAKENINFFTILYREKAKYRHQFQILKQKLNERSTHRISRRSVQNSPPHGIHRKR